MVREHGAGRCRATTGSGMLWRLPPWRTARRGSLSTLGIAFLVGLWLYTLVTPRFGVLWHEHADGHRVHTHQHLSITPAAHTAQAHGHGPLTHPHPHEHEDEAQVSLTALESADLHWHAFDNSLPSFYRFVPPLILAVPVVFLRPHSRLLPPLWRLCASRARAPPAWLPGAS
jgi:hypothetical protein